MGETREAKRTRLERGAGAMKARHEASRQKTLSDRHDAFRRGYNAGKVAAAARPPFSSAELKAAWIEGFELGTKGIMVDLPDQAFLENTLPPPENKD